MPFLSALEVVYDIALYKSTFTLLYSTLQINRQTHISYLLDRIASIAAFSAITLFAGLRAKIQ